MKDFAEKLLSLFLVIAIVLVTYTLLPWLYEIIITCVLVTFIGMGIKYFWRKLRSKTIE